MIFQKQALRHDPKSGVYGDCFRTAIACVLELPRDDVPHVFADGLISAGEADRRMNDWLGQRGLVQIVLAFSGDDMTLEQLLGPICSASSYSLPEFVLMGRSRNGTNHCVVCKGHQIEWDPSLDDSGIVGPADDGYWWLTFLSVTRPTGKRPLESLAQVMA